MIIVYKDGDHDTSLKNIVLPINSSDRKEYWICNHKGFKTDTFSTYLEAILKVENRVKEYLKIQKSIV